MRISFGQFSAAGKWGAAGLRNVRVLRQEQRLEAALLSRACQFPDIDSIVCWKIENTNTHCQFSCPAPCPSTQYHPRNQFERHDSSTELVVLEGGAESTSQ